MSVRVIFDWNDEFGDVVVVYTMEQEDAEILALLAARTPSADAHIEKRETAL